MIEEIKEFFDNLFHSSDVSGIRKTNSYYRNLEICERMHKKEIEQKKEEKRIARQTIRQYKEKQGRKI